MRIGLSTTCLAVLLVAAVYSNASEPNSTLCPTFPALVGCRPLAFENIRRLLVDRKTTALDLTDTDVDDGALYKVVGMLLAREDISLQEITLVHTCSVTDRGIGALKEMRGLVVLNYSQLGCNGERSPNPPETRESLIRVQSPRGYASTASLTPCGACLHCAR